MFLRKASLIADGQLVGMVWLRIVGYVQRSSAAVRLMGNDRRMGQLQSLFVRGAVWD